jgi:hypothetical protein
MKTALQRLLIIRPGRRRAARRLATLYRLSGLILGLITVILSALNAVSVQQAIALALPATVITIGGLINSIVADSLTAWRRGFRQGCRVAAICQQQGLSPLPPGSRDCESLADTSFPRMLFKTHGT